MRSLFESYGTVDRVNIVTDRETGQALFRKQLVGCGHDDLFGVTHTRVNLGPRISLHPATSYATVS